MNEKYNEKIDGLKSALNHFWESFIKNMKENANIIKDSKEMRNYDSIIDESSSIDISKYRRMHNDIIYEFISLSNIVVKQISTLKSNKNYSVDNWNNDHSSVKRILELLDNYESNFKLNKNYSVINFKSINLITSVIRALTKVNNALSEYMKSLSSSEEDIANQLSNIFIIQRNFNMLLLFLIHYFQCMNKLI